MQLQPHVGRSPPTCAPCPQTNRRPSPRCTPVPGRPWAQGSGGKPSGAFHRCPTRLSPQATHFFYFVIFRCCVGGARKTRRRCWEANRRHVATLLAIYESHGRNYVAESARDLRRRFSHAAPLCAARASWLLLRTRAGERRKEGDQLKFPSPPEKLGLLAVTVESRPVNLFVKGRRGGASG